MLRNDVLLPFTDHVQNTADTVEDASDELQAHFMTTAHRDTYHTEWNTLSFKVKCEEEPLSQQLDLLL